MREQRQSLHFPNSPPPVTDALEIKQPLDHFDPQIKVTFGQRYWVNDAFWKPQKGPIFLYIGGEGTLNEKAVLSGAHLKYAQQYGALIFAVEHRFYGQSMNEDGLKLENLKFLSSQQALADLANFHLQMSKSYNLTDKNKWIAFGGSYAGALTAWFRIKYPHLVHAAVASSAPVRALVNFDEYCDVVAKSLSTEIVGGSEKCLVVVRNAFAKVDELIQKRDLSRLGSDFLSCQPLGSDLDVLWMANNLADVFMGTVQYNNEHYSSMNIKSMCEVMTQGPDAYQNLASLNKIFLNQTHQNCSDNSWQNYINLLSNVTFDRTQGGAGMRQWTYQTCSQFGYYQTCDDNDCPFSRYITLSPNFAICESIFNLNTKEVYDRINFTNAYYGSDDPQGSRILFVNGLIDPWHALSVLENISQSELAILIAGTAHCADMHDESSEDPPALTKAREKILDTIGEWLSVTSVKDANVPKKDASYLRRQMQSSFQKL